MEELGIPCKKPLSEEEIELQKESEAQKKALYKKIRAKTQK